MHLPSLKNLYPACQLWINPIPKISDRTRNTNCVLILIQLHEDLWSEWHRPRLSSVMEDWNVLASFWVKVSEGKAKASQLATNNSEWLSATYLFMQPAVANVFDAFSESGLQNSWVLTKHQWHGSYTALFSVKPMDARINMTTPWELNGFIPGW